MKPSVLLALPARFLRPVRWKSFITLNVIALMLLQAPAMELATTNAPVAGVSSNNLAEMDIDQLWNTRVTILGPSEAISRTPAAVSVVTQEEIKRSGAMNVPEALRLVPGMDVAQIDGSQWAVSSRGFNDQFANKLLVLQDGRSIYTPLFGGVFWDVQGPMMEDIDRIEVIRGPGATLWGANAVNGVINILTKGAESTQGWLVSAGGGTFDRAFANARYGGKVGENLSYRIYGTYLNHDDTPLPNGSDSQTDWQLGRGGFRMDWTPTLDDLVTFQGDGYGGKIREVFMVAPAFTPTPDVMHVRGLDVLGRWTHMFSDTSNFKLQAYYDRTERQSIIFDEPRDTFDLNFQHEFQPLDRHEMIWGLGYRITRDSEANTSTVSWADPSRTENLFSGFVQDEIALVKDKLNLIVGSKLEDNGYTGFEFEPGTRLLWTPTTQHTFWGAISRAVRTPTRSDNDVIFNQPPGVTVYGNGGQQSERMIAYELGYRTQPIKQLSFDVALYYNDYDRLRSTEFGPSPTQPVSTPFFPLHFDNRMAGESYGASLSATWRVTDWWRLQPNYTVTRIHLHTLPGSTDTTSVPSEEGQSPQNQVTLRSMMDFPHGWTVDCGLRYVDRLAFVAPAPSVSSYITADARLAWRPRKNLEISLVGQSLFQKRHAEFSSNAILANPQTQVPRSVYGKVTWEF